MLHQNLTNFHIYLCAMSTTGTENDQPSDESALAILSDCVRSAIPNAPTCIVDTCVSKLKARWIEAAPHVRRQRNSLAIWLDYAICSARNARLESDCRRSSRA